MYYRLNCLVISIIIVKYVRHPYNNYYLVALYLPHVQGLFMMLCAFCLSPVCTGNILNAAHLQTTVCNIQIKLEVLSWLRIPILAAYLLCHMLQHLVHSI